MEDKDPLTELVIGAAIEVHKLMGPGLLESIYQKCMEEELRLRDCPYEAQLRLPPRYKGVALGDDLVMDFYFPGRLVVELKAVEKLLPVHEAQLLTYLRFSAKRIGFLLNFWRWPMKDGGIKRILNSRISPLSSAPPQTSA